MTDWTKYPRVYVDRDVNEDALLTLDGDVHHYLKNVMRLQSGDSLRLFNGRDGEYLGTIEEIAKKNLHVRVERQMRPHKAPARAVHLLFAPIKKERMDYLIEKAVELGATHIHPVLTQNTDIRKIKDDRLQAQIREAAEQCERLDIPVLLPPKDLFGALAVWDKNIPLCAALERFDAKPFKQNIPAGDVAILIGPSGGFTQAEKDKIAALSFIRPVSLGENILRSETAAAAALAILNI